MSAAPIEIKRAGREDLQALYELDALILGDAGRSFEPAAPGEFESGLQTGAILIAAQDAVIAGFAQVEPLGDDLTFLASLAVHPAHRRRGIGSLLLDAVLRDAERTCSTISTATSPDNLGMLSLLFRGGFVAMDYFGDYYGPGKHRIVLDRYNDRLVRSVVDRRLIPRANIEASRSLLATGGWAIRAILVVGGREYFEFVRFAVHDREALKADESHAGMGFSGTVIAALTFLLGFSISSARFSDDVRVLLAVAVIASLLSMVVYANAFGELARLQAGRWVRRMEVGNILSEYGGIVPLLVVVPVALMAVVESDTSRWALGATGTVVLVSYFISSISLWTRYQRRWWSRATIGIIATAPLLWLLVSDLLMPSAIWTILVVGALLAAATDLYLSPGEVDPGCGESGR